MSSVQLFVMKMRFLENETQVALHNSLNTGLEKEASLRESEHKERINKLSFANLPSMQCHLSLSQTLRTSIIISHSARWIDSQSLYSCPFYCI